MIIYMAVLPIVIYIVVRMLDAKYRVNGSKLLLVGACLLFSLSLIIPSPKIHGQDTQFLTHLLGGGVFTGLIWLYFKPLMKNMAWYRELLYLYALVSGLGVLNELYELFSYEVLGQKQFPLTDTSWDLFANTLGMLLFYAVYRGGKYVKRLFFSR